MEIPLKPFIAVVDQISTPLVKVLRKDRETRHKMQASKFNIRLMQIITNINYRVEFLEKQHQLIN